MSTPNRGFAPKRVLYVDDDQVYASLLKRALEHLGHRVTLFATARRALHALNSMPGAWDIVVTDFNTHGGGDLAVAKAVQERHSHLICAVVSNYINDETIAATDAAGAKLLFDKPTSLQQFANLIERVDWLTRLAA